MIFVASCETQNHVAYANRFTCLDTYYHIPILDCFSSGSIRINDWNIWGNNRIDRRYIWWDNGFSRWDFWIPFLAHGMGLARFSFQQVCIFCPPDNCSACNQKTSGPLISSLNVFQKRIVWSTISLSYQLFKSPSNLILCNLNQLSDF